MIAATHPTNTWYLLLAAALFAIGCTGVLVRRNPLVMFMSIELQLNAVNLALVSFARLRDDLGGQVLAFFSMVVAAAEVVVGLAIIVSVFRRRRGATADDLDILKEINRDTRAMVSFSFSTVDEDIKRHFEPRSPSIQKRLDAMAEVARALGRMAAKKKCCHGRAVFISKTSCFSLSLKERSPV